MITGKGADMEGSTFTIKEQEAEAVIQRAVCECGGEMVGGDNWLLSSPPKMAHHCNSCKAVVMLGDKYPRTIFRPRHDRLTPDNPAPPSRKDRPMTAPDKIWIDARDMAQLDFMSLVSHTPQPDEEPYHHQRTVDELLGALENLMLNCQGNAAGPSRWQNSWHSDITAARALIAKHRKGGA